MRPLTKCIVMLVCVGLLVPSLLIGQEPVRLGRPGTLDLSYCRFDSTETALCEEFLPPPIHIALTQSGMHPRLVPLFITIEDAVFEYPDKTVSGKILYSTDGQNFATLYLLGKPSDGPYEILWETQQVPPAGHVKVRMKDLTGDGRPEIIATARGGVPLYEAMAAFDFDGRVGHLISNRGKGFHDHSGLLGIGIGVIDSLAVSGRPAIEVWQDEPASSPHKFVRIRHHYSDSARLIVPLRIDTLPELPRWCKARRQG